MGTRVRLSRAALVLAVAALPAVGCSPGGGDEPGRARAGSAPAEAPGRTYNATDVMFLQMLLPHHGQGLEIVRMAEGRATRAEVRTLAAAIEVTQADEIKAMAGWLTSWGQPLRAEDDAHAAHGGMPGTTAEEIAVLEKTTGEDFERRFLNMLIAHQDDAVQIATMETSGGENPSAKALAERVARSRAAQIRQMLALLGRPG